MFKNLLIIDSQYLYNDLSQIELIIIFLNLNKGGNRTQNHRNSSEMALSSPLLANQAQSRFELLT